MSSGSQRSGNESLSFEDRVTGRQVLQLTSSWQRSVHGYYDIPPWSPRDRRIAFSSMDPGAREGDIYVVGPEGADLTWVAHSRSMSANDGAMAQWSSDGDRIYFKDREEHAPIIAWVEADTGERGFCAGDLRMVSPVADKLAFHTSVGDYADHQVVSRRDEMGVFVRDVDSGETYRLATVADCLDLHPRRNEIADWHLFVKHTKWSPDGQRIMFVFTNEIRFSDKFCELPRVKDVYVIDADGSGLARVGEFGNHPLWHPNGRQVLTNGPVEGRPGNSLVLIDVVTGERDLASGAMSGSGHPSYSPDGRCIVLDHVLRNEGYGSLNLIDVAVGSVEHLVQVRVEDHTHVGTHLHPVWSRDGGQVLYASDASGTAQLCIIDV
ncbi:TolB family protein [Candidatus Latescibacterota bacterium]